MSLLVRRHSSADGELEIAQGRPDVRLSSRVHGYHGWRERMNGPLRRRVPASTAVTIVMSFDGGPHLLDSSESGRADARLGSFVAGPAEFPLTTEHSGSSYGVEVSFTPPGAGAFLDLPLDELAQRQVPVDEILGAEGWRLLERLHDATSWERRFAILDGVVAARQGRNRRHDLGIAWAWECLQATGGQVSVSALADELGWSGRAFGERFRERIGMTPKRAARIVRFERAAERLARDPRDGLAGLAYACGYADQAHLTREFRAFAGTTPGDFAAELLPADAGIAAPEPA
jgi:AraC-like DNA-binding protein